MRDLLWQGLSVSVKGDRRRDLLDTQFLDLIGHIVAKMSSRNLVG